jgi:gas vesicle protein
VTAQTTSLTLVKTSLLAGFVGAGIALLLAPTSGREARSIIRHVASRAQQQARRKTEEVADRGADEMSNRLENIQEEVRMRRERKRQSPVLTNWEEEV